MKLNKTTRSGTVRRLAIAAAAMAVAASIAGCASDGDRHSGRDSRRSEEPASESGGIYARSGDQLIKLDGNASWERKTWPRRSDLPPGIEIVVRDPRLATLSAPVDGAVGLRRVAWVRSEISDSGRITSVDGTQWRAVALPGLEVPVEYTAPGGSKRDAITLRPREPLDPGLYSVYLDAGQGSRAARFGVGWPQVDKRAYSATVCVDHYVGDSSGYRSCSEQPDTAASANGLRIYLVDPQTRQNTTGRSVLISGVVVNDSDGVRAVPVLTAELRSPAGHILRRWRFRAAVSRLDPGESTSFRSEVDDIPKQTHSVNVNFGSTQAMN